MKTTSKTLSPRGKSEREHNYCYFSLLVMKVGGRGGGGGGGGGEGEAGNCSGVPTSARSNHFCAFYRYVNPGESLTNLKQSLCFLTHLTSTTSKKYIGFNRDNVKTCLLKK